MTARSLDLAIAFHVRTRQNFGYNDQEIMNDLIALALVVAAHDIPDPRRSLARRVGATAVEAEKSSDPNGAIP